MSVDIDEIFDFENVLLIIYIFEIVWVHEYSQSNDSMMNFLHSLRALRTAKLRHITKLFGYYIDRYLMNLKTDDLAIEENFIDEEGEMSKFIVNEMVGFMGGILFESSLLLALDKSLDFNGFYPYNKDVKFDYLASAYFVIVSFSTIGYGDIFP